MGVCHTTSRIAVFSDETALVENLARAMDADVLKMVLFDKNSKEAFFTYLKATKMSASLEFYEAIDELGSLLEEGGVSNQEFIDSSRRILLYVYFNKVFIEKQELRAELKSLFATGIQGSREAIMSKLVLGQREVIACLNTLLPNFERSKEFANCIKYCSVPYDAAMNRSSSKRISGSDYARSASFDGNSINPLRGSFRAKNVLLVEDSSLVAKIIISYLQRRKYTVVHAVSYKEAAAALVYEEMNFVVVLYSLDIEGRALDAYMQYNASCDERGTARSKFVGIVRDPLAPLTREAVTSGFNSMLVKPFDCRDVMNAIR